MNWTAADILRIAPEFTSVPIPVIDSYSAMADLQLNEDTLGDRYKQAGMFLTAHLLATIPPSGTVGQSNNAAGPVTSQSVGEVSVSYASLSDSTGIKGSLGLSRFGIMYARIVKLGGYGIQVL